MNGILSVENRHARRRVSEIDISEGLPRKWGHQALATQVTAARALQR
jgi:hypothetical protein